MKKTARTYTYECTCGRRDGGSQCISHRVAVLPLCLEVYTRTHQRQRSCSTITASSLAMYANTWLFSLRVGLLNCRTNRYTTNEHLLKKLTARSLQVYGLTAGFSEHY